MSTTKKKATVTRKVVTPELSSIFRNCRRSTSSAECACLRDRGAIEFPDISASSGLGHLMGTVDESGLLTTAFVYGPFGEIIEQSGAVDSHLRRFNGKEVDQLSRLNYYGYRYYDPLSLQWTQADPLYRVAPDIAHSEPRLMSLYTFSLNNPVRYVDPDGREPVALVSARSGTFTSAQQKQVTQGMQLLYEAATGEKNVPVTIRYVPRNRAYKGQDLTGNDIVVWFVDQNISSVATEQSLGQIDGTTKAQARESADYVRDALDSRDGGVATEDGFALVSLKGDISTKAQHEGGHQLGLAIPDKMGNDRHHKDNRNIMSKTATPRADGKPKTFSRKQKKKMRRKMKNRQKRQRKRKRKNDQ